MIKTQRRKFEDVVRDIFDMLMTQGVRCVKEPDDQSSPSVYHNEHGHSCVIGFLLPKNRKIKSSDLNIIELLQTHFEHLGKNRGFIKKHKKGLALLQDIHDGYDSTDYSQIALEKIEAVYKIDLAYWSNWLNLGRSYIPPSAKQMKRERPRKVKKDNSSLF